DPAFAVDEGEAHAALFEAAWDRLLGESLDGRAGAGREQWLPLLARADLGGLRQRADAPASFQIPSEEPDRSFHPPRPPPYAEGRRGAGGGGGRSAAAAGGTGKGGTAGKAGRAGERFLGGSRRGDGPAAAAAAAALRAIGSVGTPNGWSPVDAKRVDRLRRVA